jgi:hypothetical protein
MKRLGFRSAFVSTEENACAGIKCSQTTEPQLFYIVSCAYVAYAATSIPVFFISTTKGFPELKSSCDIGCGSILESI